MPCTWNIVEAEDNVSISGKLVSVSVTQKFHSVQSTQAKVLVYTLHVCLSHSVE